MDTINSPPTGTSSHSTSFYNPLLISMLGIVCTSIVIIFYHLFLVKYCITRHGGATTAAMAPQASPVAEPRPFTGVDEKLLQTILISTFAAVKGGMDQEECVVCLGVLEDDDAVRLLPNCKHAFHLQCVDRWFVAHATCPLCRSPILEKLDLEPSDDGGERRSVDANRETGESSAGANTSRASPSPRARPSFGLLRHCASLVHTAPADRRASASRLKRSLSMDQSLAVIDREGANMSSGPSSRRMLARSGSCGARPLSRFDRVSTKWLRSFSRLRLGKSSGNTPILPY